MLKLHLHITEDDIPYLARLKPFLAGRAITSLDPTIPTTVMDICLNATKKNSTQIISTSPKLLQLLLGRAGEKLPSLDTYAGSIFHKFGFDFLFLDPLELLLSVPYSKFLTQRFLSKYTEPSSWLQVPEFKWSLFEPSKADYLLDLFSTASFISADIETIRDDPERRISCISFTAVHFNSSTKSYTTTTIVIPFDSTFNIAFTRSILRLPIPKVFQNGKFDIANLFRYNCITTAWTFDTINLFHSWYPELPKDLGLITAFCIRDWVYHKDESKTSDLMQYYEYNGKDSFVTAIDCLALLNEMPPWALNNYYEEFPRNFPCVYTEARGIKVDKVQFFKVKAELEKNWKEREARLRIMVSNPNYNPGSWQQTRKLYEILGSGDVKKTNKIGMAKVASRHPLNKRLMDDITKYKENVKLEGTYVDEEKLWWNRIYFAQNPHGTDTDRQASKESQFFSGFNITNIPRETKGRVSIKSYFIADNGFLFGEADYAQAEARCGAFLSGDKKYIAAISDESKDFHAYNVSEFFGIPYEQVCTSVQSSGIWKHERLLKDLIDIEKRVIYGVQYNMTAQVLLDTMGIDNVIKAKQLLKLPSNYSLLNCCQFLLNKFDETYPGVRGLHSNGDWKAGEFYKKIQHDVLHTNFLVSPRGHRRYCFPFETTNGKLVKRDMNRYAAHPPQHLNSSTLNIAYMKVFYNIQLKNWNDFHLGPQIHDSIWFQYRKEREDLAWAVKKEMEMTVEVTDPFGIKRDLFVPVDLKGGSNRWSELKTLQL